MQNSMNDLFNGMFADKSKASNQQTADQLTIKSLQNKVVKLEAQAGTYDKYFKLINKHLKNHYLALVQGGLIIEESLHSAEKV